MTDYYELLKHPNWQRKRLEILQRANFSCENCGSADKPLHVHHTYYESKHKPWEYPNESLHALCEDCHSKVQDRKTLFNRQLGKVGYAAIDGLYGYALGTESQENLELPIDVLNYEVASGLADFWSLPADLVVASLVEGSITGAKLMSLVAAHGAPQKPWLERIARNKNG